MIKVFSKNATNTQFQISNFEFLHSPIITVMQMISIQPASKMAATSMLPKLAKVP
jgi:hypothetical protein